MKLKILALTYKKKLLTSPTICMGPCFCPLESHHVLQGWASKLSSWLPRLAKLTHTHLMFQGVWSHMSVQRNQLLPYKYAIRTSYYFVSGIRSQTQAIDWPLNWWGRVIRNTECNCHQLECEKMQRHKTTTYQHYQLKMRMHECATLPIINNLLSDLLEIEEGCLLLTSALSSVSTLLTN